MNKTTVSIIIIILFHVVGLIGFLVPALRPFFLQLVPFHLLLMALVIVINHYRPGSQFLTFGVIVFLSGFLAEWIGVHKHWIFGNYSYGQTLGGKLFDIPLLIGVNWFMLVYAVGVLLQRSRIINRIARVVFGALLLTLLDVLIERIAIHFDYWHWAHNTIPLQNYAGWFVLSAVLLAVFEAFRFRMQSVVAPVLLLAQFVFFGVLQVL